MALAEGNDKILDFLKQHFEIGLPGVDRQVKKTNDHPTLLAVYTL